MKSPSGVCYCRLGYYNPSTGRFINRDPITEWGGVNLYAMVGNNLISYADPLGLKLEPAGDSPEFNAAIAYLRRDQEAARIIDYLGKHFKNVLVEMLASMGK